MSDFNLQELNRALCAALGIENTEDVQSVVLVLSPHALPSVTVSRALRDSDGFADGFAVACSTHRLVPDPVPMTLG